MRLGTRSKIWTVVVLFLVLANSLLGIVTLRELRKMSLITMQDHEVSTVARHIKADLARYLASGLAAQITRNSSDVRQRQRAHTDLINQLTINFGPSVNRKFSQDLGEVKSKINRLLMLGQSGQEAFVSAEFRKAYAEAGNSADRLIERSSQIVAAEREHDTLLYKKYFVLELLFSLLTVILVAARLIAVYRDIVLPVQSLHTLVQRYKNGELSARWNSTVSNEIGLIGQTINRVADDAQQRQSERIEFVGSVVHDLKNPLSAISLNCDLILRNKDQISQETAIKSIERIKTQTDRLKRLAEDLLKTTKNERVAWDIQMSNFSLEQLARDTIELFKASQPDHGYTLEVEGPISEIHADRDRIAQVLINLLSNATKYSPAGTTVEVAVGAESSEAAFVEIRDRGLGIPNDKKATIFEPFERLESAKEMSEGTGLGLAIAKEMVRAHGGNINVHDRDGGGSVFRVSFPTNREKASA